MAFRPAEGVDLEGQESFSDSGSYSYSYSYSYSDEGSRSRSSSRGSGSYSYSYSYSEESEEENVAAGEEEEDEGEQIKYRTFPIAAMSANQQITCMVVREKFILVGTDQGMVHVLDANGDRMAAFARHVNVIKDVSCDSKDDYIASVCVGGLLTIEMLYPDSKDDFHEKTFDTPLTCVAVHPDYGKRNDKPYIVGGLDGAVSYVTKTRLFGNRTSKKLEKEQRGKIHALRWRGDLVAWANDYEIVLCNMGNERVFQRFPRPATAPRPDMFSCCLFWETDTSLLIGWGNWVLAVAIKEASMEDRLKASASSKGARSAALVSMYTAEAVGGFETDDLRDETNSYRICGLAPFGPNELFMLTCTVKEKIYVQQLHIRIVDRVVGDCKSLSVYKGKSNNISLSYSLAHFPQEFGENSYYIVSPDLIIVAELCDDDDKVEFLLSQKRYTEAFELGKSRPLNKYTSEQLGTHLLHDLVARQRYAEAASKFRDILGETSDAAPKWHHWIDHYIKKKLATVLAPYLPCIEDGVLNGPQLEPAIYELVLLCCLESELEKFKEHLAKFRRLYDEAKLCQITTDKYKRMKADRLKGGCSEEQLRMLGEALSILLEYREMHAEALGVLMDIKGSEELFQFIDRHSLYHKASEVLEDLFKKDLQQTIKLLLRDRSADFDQDELDPLGPDAVLSRMNNPKAGPACQTYLWAYLVELKRVDSSAFTTTARRHPQLFVRLYAQYDRPSLLMFMKSIHSSLNLKETYALCEKQGLLEEKVYAMAKMGNPDRGLNVLIKELRNVEKAIDFIQDFSDEDQKALYEELFNLVFTQEKASPTFTHICSIKGETLQDIAANFGVKKEDIAIEALHRCRVMIPGKGKERVIDVAAEFRRIQSEEDLKSLSGADKLNIIAQHARVKDVTTIPLLEPSKVVITPRLVSRLLTAVADPHVGETPSIDAGKLVRRITGDQLNIANLGSSLSAITASKGSHMALMQTLLRVLNGDVGYLHSNLGRKRAKAIRCHPGYDRECQICSNIVDRDGLVIFACNHAGHAACVLDETMQNETATSKVTWLQEPEEEDAEAFFRQPHKFIKDKPRRPIVQCLDCPLPAETS